MKKCVLIKINDRVPIAGKIKVVLNHKPRGTSEKAERIAAVFLGTYELYKIFLLMLEWREFRIEAIHTMTVAEYLDVVDNTCWYRLSVHIHPALDSVLLE